MPTFTLEEQYWDAGRRYVAGVDEVGRGPLAGPVVVSAVILPPDCDLPGLDDSKKLTPANRERLYELIRAQATAISVTHLDHEAIDQINILQATMYCMTQAIMELSTRPDVALIDGNRAPACPCPAYPVVRGDQLSMSIAAASVIAKVTRDRIMCAYADVYPDYAFDSNKGYASQTHIQAIRRHGLCGIHRVTFCRKILSPQPEQLKVWY